MRALVSTRSDRPPHALIADLPTAFNVDRLLTRSGKGAFAFDIPSAGLLPGAIDEGRIVVIESTGVIPPYVGVITKISEAAASATLEVSGDNYASITYGMAVDRAAPFTTTGGGAVARELLRRAQGGGRSAYLTAVRGSGDILQGSIDFGGQLLGGALDALAGRLGNEWWIEHTITRAQLTSTLVWSRRRGIDRPTKWIHEGIGITDADYNRDALGRIRTAIAVGGGGPVGTRPSVAISDSPGGATSKAAQSVGVAGVATASVGAPLASRDTIALRPTDNDTARLADVARRAKSSPQTARYTLALTVTMAAAEGLRPGDTIRLQMHSIGGGLYAAARINAMQPDEAAGDCDLDVTL